MTGDSKHRHSDSRSTTAEEASAIDAHALEGPRRRAHAQRLQDVADVHVVRHLGQVLAAHHGGHATRVLDHFDATTHVAAGLNQRLAIFNDQRAGQVVEVGVQQLAPTEHDACALRHRGRAPLGEGLGGCIASRIHLLQRRLLHISHDLAHIRRIEDSARNRAFSHNPRTSDEVLRKMRDEGGGQRVAKRGSLSCSSCHFYSEVLR